jgi:glycosyltransferase involved in cell wall biosynthesis
MNLDVRGNFAWLLTGHFSEDSSHHALLYAFSKVVVQLPRTVLLLAGSGPARSVPRRALQALGIEAKVRYVSRDEDMASLMAASDACAISSTAEIRPRQTLIEAACAGLPVLDDGSGAQPDAMAAAMLRIMNMPADARIALGEEARQSSMERHGFDAVTSEWEQVYRDIMELKGASAAAVSAEKGLKHAAQPLR